MYCIDAFKYDAVFSCFFEVEKSVMYRNAALTNYVNIFFNGPALLFESCFED